MTKTELVAKVAAEAGVTKATAAKVFEAIINGIADSLKTGDRIAIVGFGTFSVSERKARTGRNPQTGKEIKIPAKTVPKFTAGAALKEAVGGKVKAKAKPKAKTKPKK